MSHLNLIAMYQVDSNAENLLAFVIPDPATKTKNGLFIEFDNGKLVEITSSKSGMNKQLYSEYLNNLLVNAERWKASGVSVVLESKENSLYVYKDQRSYMTIGGGKLSNKYFVDISFTEKQYHERKHGILEN